MASPPNWQNAWDGLNRVLSALGAYVASKTSGIRWIVAHHDDENFPLRASLSFSGFGSAADELLVVAVDIHEADEEIRWTSDIATDLGVILEEGPTWKFAKSQIDADRVSQSLAGTIDFLKRHEEFIVERVRATFLDDRAQDS